MSVVMSSGILLLIHRNGECCRFVLGLCYCSVTARMVLSDGMIEGYRKRWAHDDL